MRTFGLGLLVLAVAAAAVADEKMRDEKKPIEVTADELAKEFKDDPAAARKKYEGAEIRLTGTATLAIGSGRETEVLVENASKLPVRLATGGKRPDKFPAKFTATAAYKDFFAMAKELSLTASGITFGK